MAERKFFECPNCGPMHKPFADKPTGPLECRKCGDPVFVAVYVRDRWEGRSVDGERGVSVDG